MFFYLIILGILHLQVSSHVIKNIFLTRFKIYNVNLDSKNKF